MHTDDIRPPAAFDRTPADDALDLALAVTTAGLPAVTPSVTLDQNPARHYRVRDTHEEFNCPRCRRPVLVGETAYHLGGGAHPYCQACHDADATPPDPARAAWSDHVTQSNDLMNLCVFVKVAQPYLEMPCGCSKDFECIRCQSLRIALKYLPDPAAEPQQGTEPPW